MTTTTLDPIGVLLTIGVAGTGSEETVVIPVGARTVDVFALAQDITISSVAAGTGSVLTSTTIPAGTGYTILDSQRGLGATLTVYILQATAAGTAQFTVRT